MSTKILSFDAESNGLYGPAFAIGAFLYIDGMEVSRFIGRYRLTGEINAWVKENVLPQMGEFRRTIPLMRNFFGDSSHGVPTIRTALQRSSIWAFL